MFLVWWININLFDRTEIWSLGVFSEIKNASSFDLHGSGRAGPAAAYDTPQSQSLIGFTSLGFVSMLRHNHGSSHYVCILTHHLLHILPPTGSSLNTRWSQLLSSGIRWGPPDLWTEKDGQPPSVSHPCPSLVVKCDAIDVPSPRSLPNPDCLNPPKGAATSVLL